MIRCVIIDDELPAIHVLKRYIDRIPNLEIVGTETNPIAGIDMIKREKPDVVFLDIQMDELNGIELAKLLDDSVKIVFCTAYSEFAVTSYEFDAVDYLMKPIEFTRFVKAVQRVSDALTHRSTANQEAIPNDYIYVKAGRRGKLLKIDLDSIDFVEALSNYVVFHCGTVHTTTYLSLKELEERLPGSEFMRIHKSFMVALKQISLMENNVLILKDGHTRIPIGASYKEVFLERMKDKLMEKQCVPFNSKPMQKNITTPAAVLVVSSFEIVRAGIVAVMLKMEATLIESITEKESVDEAIEACSRQHFPLIITDESIVRKENFKAVERLIEITRHSIVICQLFRKDAETQNLLRNCGLSGYFFRSIELEIFRNDVKKLLKGEDLNGEGIFWKD